MTGAVPAPRGRAGAIHRAAAAALLGALLPASAQAHPTLTSAVLLDVGADAVHLELQVPCDQLSLATDGTVPTTEEALSAYVLDHVSLAGDSGGPFVLRVDALRFQPVDQAPHLIAELTATPVDGAVPTHLTVHDDVVLHQVVSHKIFVSVRRDLRAGVTPDAPRLVGVLGYLHPDLSFDRGEASLSRAFAATFTLGMRHIAEGTDHVLFLLALLLVTPLRAVGGAWQVAVGGGAGDRPGRATMRRVVGVVTAFTLGHSLTLALAGSGTLHLPSAPIEVAIAVSVLVSAVHAVRPLFPGREAWVAAGFGLVHGLAFASVLAGFGFDPEGLAVALAGFNLGIEAMQLGIVVAVVPSLLLLAPTPAERWVRWAGSAVAAMGALAWIAERTVGWHNVVAGWLAAAQASGGWLLGAGLLAAAAVRLAAGPVTVPPDAARRSTESAPGRGLRLLR